MYSHQKQHLDLSVSLTDLRTKFNIYQDGFDGVYATAVRKIRALKDERTTDPYAVHTARVACPEPCDESHTITAMSVSTLENFCSQYKVSGCADGLINWVRPPK